MDLNMSIIRAACKDNGFVKLHNEEYQKPKLSIEKMGLLAYFSSLPAGWEIRDSYLMAVFDLGRDKTRAILKEFEVLGYLDRSPEKEIKGKFIDRYYTVKGTSSPLNNDGKLRPFTMVSNQVVHNTNISFKAKGLLTYLLSFPDSWELSPYQIQKVFTLSEKVTENLIKELISAGYIEKSLNNKTKKNQYIVHEMPINSINCDQLRVNSTLVPEKHDFQSMDNQSMVFQSTEKQLVDFQSVENQSTLIKINTKKEDFKEKRLNKKATAELLNKDLSNSTIQPEKPAAAFLSSQTVLKNADMVIGETLTVNQIAAVKSRIASLGVTYYAPEVLVEQIVLTLLSPKSFTYAGSDFLKKLNTIIKIINEGRWTAPTMPKEVEEVKEKESKTNDQFIREKQNAINQIAGEINFCEDVLKLHQARGESKLADYVSADISRLNNKLILIKKEIAEFNITINQGEDTYSHFNPYQSQGYSARH
jgi:hypothetical protein